MSGDADPIEEAMAEANMTICLRNDVTPILMQNLTEWEASGCYPGFYCPRNNATALPVYCTPLEPCMLARLNGGHCTNAPQGPLEPSVCAPGYYCPPGGKQNITCPEKHYCPLGSTEPMPCKWPALYCKEQSQKDVNPLGVALVLLVNGLLILSVLAQKIIQRFRRREHKPSGVRNGAKNWMIQKRHTYSKIGVPSLVRGRMGVPMSYKNDDPEEGTPELESRISTVRRTNTGFDALMSEDFSMQDAFEMDDKNDEGQTTDLQAFVQSMSRCLGASKFGLSFEFQDLSFQPKGSPKKILDQVSGCINSGSLWGVMGASGAGKSTFVNVLMGKQKHTGGITKVNGIPGSISKYKKIIGYVPQDDIVLPELTVRENILHSARIRLPSSWTDKEIQAHVDILISCLQLSHVTNSLVGEAGKPVISGGQRKRVSIGMELAAAPMALFLDEPTSGLDATSAASIMKTLKALSRMGITVVTIIHQPRQEIWESLDSLLLFGAGRLIYHGPGDSVVRYFQHECGFGFPEHGNPADTVMDIIAGQGHLYKKSGDTSIQSLIENWSQKDRLTTSTTRDSVADAKEGQALQKQIKTRGSPWYRQTYYCFMRSIVQQWRLRTSFFSELAVGALAGTLIGLAYNSANGENFVGLFIYPYDMLSSAVSYSSVPQMALLVGISIGLTASSPGVKIFGEEKLVYWREAASGHNRFAYYIGKVFSSIPRMILANVHFTIFFMWLSTPRISWIDAFFGNQLYFYCIYGLASCVSMVTRREDGPLIATITSLIVGVLNGMSPSLAKVHKWNMTWLWRSFPGTWLAEAYFDRNVGPLAYLYDIKVASLATKYDLGYYGRDMLILFLIGTIYRILAYFGLTLLNRNRQK